MKKARVWIAEPIPCTDVAVSKLTPHAEVGVSPSFYEDIPAEKLNGLDAIIVADSFLTERSLLGADNLKIVQKFGVGVNTITIDGCTKKGIYVCNIPGINSLDVAEYAVGAMVSSLRGFIMLDSAARRAAWAARPSLVGERLSGKTVGIVGFGKIGREVARLLGPFKAKILAYDPYVDSKDALEKGVEIVSLRELLKESDIVTIHVPLTNETRDLIGEEEFRQMKRSSTLINTSRGPVVNEAALHMALSQKLIRYAVIDVWGKEPIDPDNEILGLENAQLSLHQASWTRDFFEAGMEFCSENVIRALRGEEPLNAVNEPFEGKARK